MQPQGHSDSVGPTNEILADVAIAALAKKNGGIPLDYSLLLPPAEINHLVHILRPKHGPVYGFKNCDNALQFIMEHRQLNRNYVALFCGRDFWHALKVKYFLHEDRSKERS